MMNHQTAKYWLQALAVIHIIGGLLLPILVYTPLAAPYFAHLQNAFPDSNPQSLKFLIGVFGPTVASWDCYFSTRLGKHLKAERGMTGGC